MADKIYSFRIDIEDRGAVAQEIIQVDASLKKLNETRAKAEKDLKKGLITQQQYEKILRSTKLSETNLRQSKTELAKADRNLSSQMMGTKGSMQNLRLETSLLIKEANKLDLATAQGKKRFAELQQQVDKNKTSIRNFDRSMSGSKTLVGEYGKGIVQSFKSMAAGMIGFAALLRVMKDLVGVTGDFDTATAKLASVTLSTRKEISALTAQAKQLGATSIFTATQVTELQISLAKLGFTAKQIAEATPGVVNFATAVGADLGAAAKVAGIAVKAFGLDTLETEAAVASLAIGTTKSALAFEDYETILGTVGAVARTYGFTLEDTIALTGTLRDAGLDASKAATATRNILLNLADANGALAQKLGGSVGTVDELIDGLVKLNAAGVGLGEALELTDKRSVNAFTNWLAGAENIRRLKGEVTDATDELRTMVELQLDSYAGDVKELASAWEGLILSMKTEGVIRGVVTLFKDMLIQLNNLDTAFGRTAALNEEQTARFYTNLGLLSNAQAQQFQAAIKHIDKLIDEEGKKLSPEQISEYFQRIEGIQKKAGDKLTEEYLKRRRAESYQDLKIHFATEQRKAIDAIDLATRREADAIRIRDKAAEEQAKKDKAAAEKQAKEAQDAQDKLDAENLSRIAKHDAEVLRFKEQFAKETEKALKDSSTKLGAAEGGTEGGRVDLLRQELAAVQAEEVKGEAARIDRLNRSLALERQIRNAAFILEEQGRADQLAQLNTDYMELGITLDTLKKRLFEGDITKAYFDIQSEAITNAQANITATQGEIDEQSLIGAEKLENDLTAIKTKGAKDRGEVEKQTQAEILAAVDQGLQIASDLTTQFSNLFEAAKQKELSAAGDNAKKREEIERKFAKRQQAISIVQAVINVAQGISKAIAQGGILGIITGAIVGIAGALQIATIARQKFESGGVVQSGSELPGYSKTSDNTMILAKPGEAILNKDQQLAIGGAGALRAAGVPGFASGGVVGAPDPGVSNLNGGMDLVGLINSIKVVNNINAMHSAEGELSLINETSQL